MLIAMLGLSQVAPVWAQGTPEQRQACTDDAYRFCQQDIPDVQAVEICLRKSMKLLSPACRGQFRHAAK